MGSDNIEKLIDKYLKGQTTKLENEKVELWLAENKPESTQWKALDADGRERWMNNLWSDIEQTVSQPRKTKTLSLWVKLTAAASVIFVFTALLVYWPRVYNKVEASHFAKLTVPAGQKEKITLEDGSVVWVNSIAELKFPSAFTGNTREVFLSGEAYFDIVHDSNKPFIVHTGKVKTTVLGTAFNIKSGNSNVVVTVTRGKVSVADERRLIAYVTPNQQLIYNSKDHSEKKVEVNAQEVIAWQNDLRFNNITFAEAVNVLQERFNVKIGFRNDIVASCRFSGTALEGDELDEILKVICAFNQATYKYNPDGSITITGSGCIN